MFHVEAVSFDLWGTLIFSNPKFKKAAADYIASYSDQKPDQVIGAIQRLKDQQNERVEQLGIAPKSGFLFQRVCEELSVTIPAQRVEEEYTRLFFQYPPEFRFPDTPRLLDHLSRRVALHLNSNTMMIRGGTLKDLLQQHMKIGVSFSSMTFSDSVGFSKPHPQIFAHSFAQFKCEKSSVVHVGDNPITDYHGALRFGFQACMIPGANANTPTVAKLQTIENLHEFCARCINPKDDHRGTHEPTEP